jgi:hypothetical protein
MSLDIGLLFLAVGAVALAIAALLRWLAMTLTGDDPGSLWDWFLGGLDILSSF